MPLKQLIPFKLPEVDWTQKPNRREKIIFAVALLIFFSAFVKSCWIPSHSAIGIIQEQMASLEVQKNALAQAANLKPLVTASSGKEFDILEEKKGHLMGSLKDMEQILKQLSDSTLLRGLVIKKSTFSEIEREGEMAKRGVELEVEGSLSSIGHYIEALESLPAPLLIESFSIIPSDDRLLAQIKGNIYGKE